MKLPEEILEKSEKLTYEKEKIRSRQHEVNILHLQGLNNNEVADKLQVSESTVEKDLHYIRQEAQSWIEEFRTAGINYSYRCSYEQLEQIQRELWKKYQEEKDPKLQLRILNSLADKIVKSSNIIKAKKNLL